MTKTIKILFAGTGFVLLLIPLIAYYINFNGNSISKNTQTWGQFGDYLNGTFMPLIALSGVILTLLLGIISNKRIHSNIQLEQLKQRPLLHIGYRDSESHLRLFMKNKGIGPLLIEKFKVLDTTKENEDIKGLFWGIPTIYNDYDDYTGNQDNTVLSPGEEIELLAFKLENKKDRKRYLTDLEEIRESIKKYKIVVEYRDVYNNKMPQYERSLSWFGRDKLKVKN